jgi:hypothetical protein
MANSKISALTSASLPLAGTEVLPIVQSGATVKVANNDLRPTQIQSNATSGILQIVGPAASSTRVMTVPNANFTAARTDASQTFSAGSNTNIFDGTGTEIVGFSKSGGNRMYFRMASNTDESLSFVNAGGTAVATVGKTGDFSLPNGNFIPSTAAKGINFTANTAAAGMTSQLLNWYEEGTWTPVYQTTNNNASLTMSGSTYGKYTRIGRQVFIEAYILTSAVSSVGTGDVLINGLPFTVLSGANGVMNISFSRRWNSNPPVSGVATGTSIALLSVNHVTGYPGNTTATAAADISTVADTMNIISIAGFYLV